MESRPLEFAEHLAAMKPYKNCVNIPRAAVRYLVSSYMLSHACNILVKFRFKKSGRKALRMV